MVARDATPYQLVREARRQLVHPPNSISIKYIFSTKLVSVSTCGKYVLCKKSEEILERKIDVNDVEDQTELPFLAQQLFVTHKRCGDTTDVD